MSKLYGEWSALKTQINQRTEHLIRSKTEISDMLVANQNKLSGLIKEIFGYHSDEDVDFDPVLPAGDVTDTTLTEAHDNYRVTVMGMYDRVNDFWQVHADERIRAVSTNFIRKFE